MPRYVTVDRIEDGVAVLEYPGREMHEVPASELPEGAAEGSVLTLEEDGGLALSPEETRRRREINRNLFNSLLE